MMRLGRLKIALGLAVGVALGAAVIILHQSRQLAACRQQRARDLAALHALQEALRQHNPQATPAEAGPPAPLAGDRDALAQRDATIERLQRELSEWRASSASLQAQLANSNLERVRALASSNEQREKEQVDWQSQVDRLKQDRDAAEAEIEASRQRSAALEADLAKVKSAASEGSARAAELGRVAAELRDLDRRQDAYLTSIMRRYRDITSQFRAMSGMLDSSHEPNSSALSSAALTRIQNAISLADDDLRELSELNAQTRQVEKKLATK
jgi:chromosome segregation ATPase